MKNANINIMLIQRRVQATFVGVVSKCADNKAFGATCKLIDDQIWQLIHEPVWMKANILNK